MTAYLLWFGAVVVATAGTYRLRSRSGRPVWRKSWFERHPTTLATFLYGLAALLVVMGVDARG